MKIFLVIQVIFSIFFQKDGYLFLKGHNLEINSDICTRQGENVICEMQKGQNKISLDVAPVRCDIPYSALTITWATEGAYETDMIEIKPNCVMYLPNVQSNKN